MYVRGERVCALEYRYPWRTEEGIRSLGAGVSWGFESPDVGTGNRTGGPLQKRLVLFTTEQSLQLSTRRSSVKSLSFQATELKEMKKRNQHRYT